MTTATAVIDYVEVDQPYERTIRLAPVSGRQDRPEPPDPAAPVADRAHTRAANCRFAMHYED
ncbi:hypothetical protein [Kitasatospora sp. SUK 42]|uniref:hypothetical protein n=1 Tax=Kitasatospora sp. SUK 42 TaxID=1588882 RepID=UPI0018C8EE0B|nr:hypothetical protein [Kitasatospora sp. SUK 42]MBV2156731.1 hypothetical protein [Kitasatospora sp. SUK 42]